MSGGNIRRLVSQEVDHVRECIERCMQMYMTKREIINLLSRHDFNIRPNITRIVWGRLEEDNPQFIRAYYVRLAVKDQIMDFNRLLSIQADLMRQRGSLAGNASHVFDSDQSRMAQQTCAPNFQNNTVWTEGPLSFGVPISDYLDESKNTQVMGKEYASMRHLDSTSSDHHELDEYMFNCGLLEEKYYPMESCSNGQQQQYVDGGGNAGCDQNQSAERFFQ